MNKINPFFILLTLFVFLQSFNAQNRIINHNCAKLDEIPENAIMQAKNSLHIAYGHTSHGSQLITGMNNLDAFMGNTGLYTWNDGPESESLDIDDYFVSGDLGNPDRTAWAERTREYLNNSNNSDVNVVIWSWCGQVSSASENDISTYLNLMSQLEINYPNVTFVYMTGHLDGSGLDGNLYLRNEQIRNFCLSNNKFLFDFADIESYNPDGVYFGDKFPNDNCDYDTDGNGSRDGNWAIEWQNSHLENEDWYSCSAAHSQALNGNLKAYAAWWLWAKIAGWEGITGVDKYFPPINIVLSNNYPNPFNPSTIIPFTITSIDVNQNELAQDIHVSIKVYDLLGREVTDLYNERISPGYHEINFDAGALTSGIYYYSLKTGNFIQTRKMILAK